ncbi:MAG: RNA polymerase-binding protein DksA [Candidatus Firestonebacteria bacterium]|nr:RNA polymerase-binding protein DksA [Candidatus Firestonebacteria bacterium]
MKKTQLESLRKMLQEQKQSLLEKVKTNVSSSKEDLPNEVRDSADAASDYYERELAWGLSETERMRLQEVEDALERIDGGSYGNCEGCGAQIAAPRLEALPFAKLCVACQSKEEVSKKNSI